MLLTKPDALPSYTRDELVRLHPDKVVVLGGPNAVASAVEQELAELTTSGTVIRLSGATLYETTAAISQWAHPNGSDIAYVATSGTYVDALAGVSVAVRDDAPILLVGDDISSEVAAELDRLGVESVVALGGSKAVVPRVAMRIWSILNDNDMPLWK
jgi:putative cell wall-binding protein